MAALAIEKCVEIILVTSWLAFVDWAKAAVLLCSMQMFVDGLWRFCSSLLLYRPVLKFELQFSSCGRA